MSIPRCVNAAAYRAARRTCREAIRRQGLCEMRHFLHDDAVRELLWKSEKLREKGFRSFEEHNIYLENGDSRSFPSSKVLVNQRDLAKSCPELIELFEWPGLRELLEIAFDLKLHCSADPLGGVYLNFFEKGDKLAWHFDRSEPLAASILIFSLKLRYSVNLILRECPRASSAPAGAFMYLPASRDFFDEHPDFDLERLDDSGLTCVVPDLEPGTLYLFAGHRSLHCVSENTSDTVRVNAIFTFNPEPNVKLNRYTRQKFFGA